MTAEEIEAGRSPRGGWTKATLAQWGVPWPPPKGWRKRLVNGEQWISRVGGWSGDIIRSGCEMEGGGRPATTVVNDGAPIHVQQIGFPLGLRDRVRFGMAIGVGIGLGLCLVAGAFSAIVQLLGAL